MKILGALLSLTGVLAIALGVVSLCGFAAEARPSFRAPMPFLLLGGGLVLLWVGNRLQGWGMLGRRKPKDLS